MKAIKKFPRKLIAIMTCVIVLFTLYGNKPDDSAEAASDNTGFTAKQNSASTGVDLSWKPQRNKTYIIKRSTDGGKNYEIVGSRGQIFSDKNKIRVFQFVPAGNFLQIYQWLKDDPKTTAKIDIQGDFNPDIKNWKDFPGVYMKELIPQYSSSDTNVREQEEKERAYYYLKDNGKASGNWKYDVLYVGGVDANVAGQVGLTTGAAEVIEEFIRDGGGVIFGHDSIAGGDDSFKYQKYYNYLAGYADVKINGMYRDGYDNFSTSFTFTKRGLLTDNIYQLPNTMVTNGSHNVGQQANNPGDIWAKFDINNSNKNKSTENNNPGELGTNFYLTTYGNCALTMLGHSNSISTSGVINITSDEKQLLTNLIYYCANVQGTDVYYSPEINREVKTVTNNVEIKDTANPGTPSVEVVSDTNSDTTIKISARDYGSKLTYVLEEYDNSDPSNPENTIKKIIDASSGIDGFFVKDGNSDWKYIKANNGELVLSISKVDGTKNLEIDVVDKAGNKSGVYKYGVQARVKESNLYFTPKGGETTQIDKVFFKAKGSNNFVEIKDYYYKNEKIELGN